MRAAAALIGALLIATQALAGGLEGMPERLTLDEAVGIALKNNPALMAMEAGGRAARELEGTARGALRPHVYVEERFTRTTDPTGAFSLRLGQGRFSQEDLSVSSLNAPDAMTDFHTSLNVEQALYDPEASISVRQAGLRARQAALMYGRERERMAIVVTEAYLGVISAQEALKAARTGLEEAREHLRIARRRYEVGIGLYSDTLQTEVYLKQTEERYHRAESDLDRAGRALGLALGIGRPVGVEGGYEPRRVPAIEEAQEMALARKDLEAAALETDLAALAREAARSRYYPRAGLAASYGMHDEAAPFGADGSSYTVAAFVRWDIYDGGARGHALSLAGHRAEEEAYRLDAARQQALYELHVAYLDMSDAHEGMALSEASVGLAEEGLRLVRVRYENGLSTVSELLEAQRTLEASRAGAVYKANAYYLSVERYRFAAGLIEFKGDD